TEQRLVTRAQIVLAASAGEAKAQIARRPGICEDPGRKWLRRWCAAPGAASLADAKRSGRRPKFTAVQVARVKAMACTPPRDKGVPLSLDRGQRVLPPRTGRDRPTRRAIPQRDHGAHPGARVL